MISVKRAINHPKLSQTFIIYRKKGEMIKGRFEQEEIKLKMSGVIGVASPKDIELIPEGDRVGGEIMIHTTREIFVTRKGSSTKDAGTSDELYWNGERYKIYSVYPYKDYGFYKAIAMRKGGQ